MWGPLRIVLLIGNAVLLAWLGYRIAKYPPGTGDQFLLPLLVPCLALNFIYLLLGNRPSNFRIFRLIDLWFDAKESELRRRARQDK